MTALLIINYANSIVYCGFIPNAPLYLNLRYNKNNFADSNSVEKDVQRTLKF